VLSYRKAVLVVRAGRLRLLGDDGEAVIHIPIEETTAWLSPGRIVRLDGPHGRLWLFPPSQVGLGGAIPKKLRRVAEAEQALTWDGGGGAIGMARGSKALYELLVRSGAKPA